MLTGVPPYDADTPIAIVLKHVNDPLPPPRSVNPNLPTVTMWSIPRDTWLYVPNWTYQRINLADTHGARVGYPGGGPGLVKATIEYNFGIHVDYYARVDFAGLMRGYAQGDAIEMSATLEAFPLQLTSVREYASSVLQG